MSLPGGTAEQSGSQEVRPHWLVVSAVAIGIGVLCGLVAGVFDHGSPNRGTDFNWSVRAARDLMAGLDPYARPYGPNAIPYPLPSVLVAMPFAPLSDRMAGMVFAGTGGTLMAYALARTGEWWRLLALLSPCFLMALKHSQWSPLFFAAIMLPALAPVVAVKPTLGIVTASVTRWTPWSLAVLGALVAITFVIQPDWPWRWYPQTRTFYGFIPLLSLPVLGLAALRWRDWRARLVLVFAAVPQQVFFYDQLLLYHVPSTRYQMALLIATGWLAFGAALMVLELGAMRWAILVGLYAPAVGILFASRRPDAREGSARRHHVDEPRTG